MLVPRMAPEEAERQQGDRLAQHSDAMPQHLAEHGQVPLLHPLREPHLTHVISAQDHGGQHRRERQRHEHGHHDRATDVAQEQAEHQANQETPSISASRTVLTAAVSSSIRS